MTTLQSRTHRMALPRRGSDFSYDAGRASIYIYGLAEGSMQPKDEDTSFGRTKKAQYLVTATGYRADGSRIAHKTLFAVVDDFGDLVMAEPSAPCLLASDQRDWDAVSYWAAAR